MEKTIRKNSKWAKVTGKRGKWNVAKGWEGSFLADRILTYPTKDGAMIASSNS